MSLLIEFKWLSINQRFITYFTVHKAKTTAKTEILPKSAFTQEITNVESSNYNFYTISNYQLNLLNNFVREMNIFAQMLNSTV